MNPNPQEIEAKFAVRNLKRVEERLQSLGAACLVPRQLETSLRYDTPQGSLTRSGQVLRLRRFDDIRLTYKGAGTRKDNVLERTEIETSLGSLEAAQSILEHLGYTLRFTYEKYRAIWQWGEAHIMLDEMPFGYFIEIEAPSAEEVRLCARQLGLNPYAALPASYQSLFARIKTWHRLPFEDITFANFENLTVSPTDYQAEFAEDDNP